VIFCLRQKTGGETKTSGETPDQINPLKPYFPRLRPCRWKCPFWVYSSETDFDHVPGTLHRKRDAHRSPLQLV
jgi:hypothetical protein